MMRRGLIRRQVVEVAEPEPPPLEGGVPLFNPEAGAPLFNPEAGTTIVNPEAE
jgi:hypothetical protein